MCFIAKSSNKSREYYFFAHNKQVSVNFSRLSWKVDRTPRKFVQPTLIKDEMSKINPIALCMCLVTFGQRVLRGEDESNMQNVPKLEIPRENGTGLRYLSLVKHGSDILYI